MLNLGLLLCKFEGCRPGPGIPGPSQAVILSTSGRFFGIGRFYAVRSKTLHFSRVGFSFTFSRTVSTDFCAH